MSFPLHTASKNNDVQRVQFLIQTIRQLPLNNFNYFINQLDSNGMSPLHLASTGEFLNVVKILVENGANVNLPDGNNQESALGYAATEGNLPIVKYLVEHHASVNQPNSEGRTPIFDAIIGRHTEVIEYLISHEADINHKDESGMTPLMLAATEGFGDVVTLLVENGANIEIQDNSNKNALFHAVLPNYTSEIDDDDDDDQVFENEEDHLEIVQYLIHHGANPYIVDNNKKTLLHYAVIKDFSFIVDYLINLPNIDINARDNENKTPLSYALHLGTIPRTPTQRPNVNATDIARALLNKNAQIDKGDQTIAQLKQLLPDVVDQRMGAHLFLNNLQNIYVREGNTLRPISNDIAYYIKAHMPKYLQPKF